jgi:putative ABC transport system permease protein
VTATAGPFGDVSVTATVSFSGPQGQGIMQTPLTVVGRSSPGGPVDDVDLNSGHWPTGPGQIAWARDRVGGPVQLGSQVTVTGTGVPGSPKLTIVGFATSITGTAEGWVTPAEVAALRAPQAPAESQMLYRFANVGSTGAVNSDIAAVRGALPHGDLAGAQSYLTVKAHETSSVATWVPFIVAFGMIGLVLSVLIVFNVVSGAVVAGRRRIGVLKSIGFEPAQVVMSYVFQVAIPAAIACVAGAALGNLLSVPMLSKTAEVYGVGSLAVPFWVDVAMPLGVLALAMVAAMLPALRAGRMSAVQAIATGRAPRASHGYAVLRLLGRADRLPRPLTLGLAGPFARPARTAVTLAAVFLGAVTVIFAVGLSTSLTQVKTDLDRNVSEPVQVNLPGPGLGGGSGSGPVGVSKAAPGSGQSGGSVPSLAIQQRTVESALRAQPGTLHYVAEADDQLPVPGLDLRLTGFGGDASWTGYQLIAGHWYSGGGEAVVNTGFLTTTGTAVGDSYPLTSGTRHVTVKIAGEIFDPNGGYPEVIGSLATLARLDPGLVVGQYDVALSPGTNPYTYADTLNRSLGQNYGTSVNTSNDITFLTIIGLIATLTLLLAVVAGLGVLNTVVLQTRERVHDLGVFKAVGMTPRQTVAMVSCSVAGIGLVAGVAAIPAGIALHHNVLPVMAHAAQTDIPSSILNVYQPWQLVLLALAGLAIAVAGALAPASWAAKARTAAALRAE